MGKPKSSVSKGHDVVITELVITTILIILQHYIKTECQKKKYEVNQVDRLKFYVSMARYLGHDGHTVCSLRWSLEEIQLGQEVIVFVLFHVLF